METERLILHKIFASDTFADKIFSKLNSPEELLNLIAYSPKTINDKIKFIESLVNEKYIKLINLVMNKYDKFISSINSYDKFLISDDVPTGSITICQIETSYSKIISRMLAMMNTSNYPEFHDYWKVRVFNHDTGLIDYVILYKYNKDSNSFDMYDIMEPVGANICMSITDGIWKYKSILGISNMNVTNNPMRCYTDKGDIFYTYLSENMYVACKMDDNEFGCIESSQSKYIYMRSVYEYIKEIGDHIDGHPMYHAIFINDKNYKVPNQLLGNYQKLLDSKFDENAPIYYIMEVPDNASIENK